MRRAGCRDDAIDVNSRHLNGVITPVLKPGETMTIGLAMRASLGAKARAQQRIVETELGHERAHVMRLEEALAQTTGTLLHQLEAADRRAAEAMQQAFTTHAKTEAASAEQVRMLTDANGELQRRLDAALAAQAELQTQVGAWTSMLADCARQIGMSMQDLQRAHLRDPLPSPPCRANGALG